MSASHRPAVAPPRPWTIATRESRLALWQAHHVKDRLQQAGDREVAILGMTTQGDQILDRALSQVGGKGLFVKELETALSCGHADLAVHSLKDVPMELPAGFALLAVLEREDPSDALVSPRFPTLQSLPHGAVVGTSSQRRAAQLRALRPDLHIQGLRGNLDTRLRKLDEGQYDAIILATAGLVRLGLQARIRERIDLDLLLPAAGQGALGIEVYCDGPRQDGLDACLAALSHTPTWLAALAERAVSRSLGGSCSMPLAAYADWPQKGVMRLRARLGHASQAGLLLAQCEQAVDGAPQAQALGEQVGAQLRGQAPEGWLPQP